MELLHAGLLFLLFCFASSFQFRSRAGYGLPLQHPELEWGRMETVIGEEMKRAHAPEAKVWRSTSSSGSSTPEAMKVPEYVAVPLSEVQEELFKPEKGARPLPNSVKEMLLGATTSPTTTTGQTRPKLVEILCHVDRMYVRIRREVYRSRDAYKYLKLGTCPVNQGTKDHYYLLYLLKTDCGFKTESNVDDLIIRNVLSYKPPGPVLREMPMSIPLQCTFPRYFQSYRVGFYPKLQGGTVFKALQAKSSFSLTPQDASGNEITGAKTYILGQPMHFEAKRTDGSASGQRMYINKCFMTSSQDSNSSPKYTVIENQGCMIDGKLNDQSKFLAGMSKTVQKIRVGALIFNDMASTSSSQQLYMHCEISMGKLTATPSSKACNYDATTKKWKELYDDDSVCSCCDSTCSPAQPKASRNMISTHSWRVNWKSEDEYGRTDPQMKSFDADTFSLEDTDMAALTDFQNYWENDY